MSESRHSIMPIKSKSDVWHSSPPPQTLAQQNAFIDSCTNWLVDQHGSRSLETFDVRSTYPEESMEDERRGDGEGDTRGDKRGNDDTQSETIRKGLVDHLSYTPLELQVVSHNQTCFFCSTGDHERHVVMANPFAQRHFVIMCDSCKMLKKKRF